MKAPTHVLYPLVGSIALLLAPAHAIEIQKANNPDTINLGSSWTGGVVPGAGDVALFDSAIASPFSVATAGDLSWQGIRLTNVTGARNGANAVIITNAGSPNTLTLGSAGVDMSTALHALAFHTRLTLTADQTWNVANANTNVNTAGLNQNEDLSFLAQAAAAPVNLGGFTVNKTGAGTVAFSSGYTISSGTFNVNAGVLHFQGGGNRVTTIQNSVNFNVANAATLRFGAQSGLAGLTTQVNAPINLNAGSTLALHLNQANTINLTGNITAVGNHTWSVFGGTTGNATTFSGNLLGSGNILYANTNTVAGGLLRMSGDNSGYSGTFTINALSGTRSLRLTGANAGSANATWSVAAANILEVDGQSVQLGTLTGAGSITNPNAGVVASTINVGAGDFSGIISNGPTALMGLTKVGTGTLSLTGLNAYTGPTAVNGGTLLTTPAQTGGSSVTVADGATFGVNQTAAGTTFQAGALTTGAVTGSTLRFDTAAFGNPTAPVINATSFTPVAQTQLNVLGTSLTAGTFTLLDYAGTLGVGGFGRLSLNLPFRVAGALVDNAGNTSVDVNISGVETPKWRGNVNGNWDIDPTNTGVTGTPNWVTSTSLTATRYVQGGVGVDSVIFDDSATGTRTVNLTTTLSPVGTVVNNSTGSYTFAGAGKLSGTGALTKQGADMLTLANTTPYDHTGGTVISGGTLQLGDGSTAGAGQISGPITNNATLAFRHAEDQTVANNIGGVGTIVKFGPNATTMTGNLTYIGETIVFEGVLAHNTPTSIANLVTIEPGGTFRLDHATGTVTGPVTNNGTLHLNGTASMTATVSGNGGLLVNSAGTKTIGGATPNTFTGTTNVNAGTLNLAKLNGAVGAVAISGDLIVNGGAVTVGAQGDQFADTTSITVNSGSINTANRTDTVANVTINAAAPVSTISGLNVTGAITITAGVQHDIVNSNGTTSANTITLSNTNVRLGANNNPSTLNIGTGGLSLTNASIVYGSAGTATGTGTVTLAGDVTASGTSAFDVNTGNPISRIDLGTSTRGFNILDGTTTVESSIISATPTAGLTKSGGGTLVLAPGTNTNGQSNYTGITLITHGAMLVNGTLSGSNVIADGGMLGGSGIINPGVQGVVLENTSKLSPGAGPFQAGLLTINGDLDAIGIVQEPASAALLFDLDIPAASDRVTLSGLLMIGDGELEFDDFLFTASFGFADLTTYTLFQTNTPILGFLGANTSGTINGLAANIQLADGGTDIVLVVPEPGSAALLLGGLAIIGARRRRKA